MSNILLFVFILLDEQYYAINSHWSLSWLYHQLLPFIVMDATVDSLIYLCCCCVVLSLCCILYVSLLYISVSCVQMTSVMHFSMCVCIYLYYFRMFRVFQSCFLCVSVYIYIIFGCLEYFKAVGPSYDWSSVTVEATQNAWVMLCSESWALFIHCIHILVSVASNWCFISKSKFENFFD